MQFVISEQFFDRASAIAAVIASRELRIPSENRDPINQGIEVELRRDDELCRPID
jgi:hypothetical protein